MSFDLYFVRPRPDATTRQIRALVARLIDADLPTIPCDAAIETRRQTLADALCAAVPGLERYAFNYASIARTELIDEALARVQWRHVALHGPDTGSGLQLELHDEWASLSVPRAERSPDEERTMRDEIDRCVRVFHDAGFTIYDPQAGAVMDLAPRPKRSWWRRVRLVP